MPVIVRDDLAEAHRLAWELADARAALVAETDGAFMVDAAAVAADFEMMTRLADGTGAAMPEDRLERSAFAIETMGIEHLTSRR